MLESVGRMSLEDAEAELGFTHIGNNEMGRIPFFLYDGKYGDIEFSIGKMGEGVWLATKIIDSEKGDYIYAILDNKG